MPCVIASAVPAVDPTRATHFLAIALLGGSGPRMGSVSRTSEGRDVCGDLAASCRAQAGRRSDMVQSTLVVVEAQEERPHVVGILGVAAPSGHHHVERAAVLDLEQAALPRRVGRVLGLGHEPVEAAALERVEPARCQVAIARHRRDGHGPGRHVQALEMPPPAQVRLVEERAVAQREQVEGHVGRGDLARESLDGARVAAGSQPAAHGGEVEDPVA